MPRVVHVLRRGADMIMRSFRSMSRENGSRIAGVASMASAILLASCATIHPPVEPMPGVLEPIHGAAFTDNLAIIRVTSNGCTTKDDLVPHLTRSRDFSILTVRRVNEDQCRNPIAEGFEVQWTFEELGLPHGTAVTVNNPFQLRDVVVRGRSG